MPQRREQIEKKLRRKLHRYLGKKFRFTELQMMMKKAKGPEEILKRLGPGLRFKTDKEASEFSALEEIDWAILGEEVSWVGH